MGKINSNNPMVTVVIATFNASSGLQVTIDSLRRQTYSDFELIIIDGGSTDDTVDILKRNEDFIGSWISEKDKGIYDAWNKAVALAKGDWIGFLGAGDCYVENALEEYTSAIMLSASKINFISSRITFVNADGGLLGEWGKPFRFTEFKNYVSIAHIGALHSRVLFDQYGLFSTEYKSAADYEFLMRCGQYIRPGFVNKILAKMLYGGISNGFNGLYETYCIQRKYSANLIPAALRFMVVALKRYVRPLLRGY